MTRLTRQNIKEYIDLKRAFYEECYGFDIHKGWAQVEKAEPYIIVNYGEYAALDSLESYFGLEEGAR